MTFMQTFASSHWPLELEKFGSGWDQQLLGSVWNLTNQRHNEEKGWTTALRTQARGSGRGAHLANGGNAWVWRRVQTSNCAGREGLGNPPSLLC